jgi:cobalt-zinc-cadmium efflux system protein
MPRSYGSPRALRAAHGAGRATYDGRVSGHHHDHTHAVDADADRTRLAIALGLILALMAAEIVAGILADSLALLSDAAHMLTDAGALALSLVALRLAARPAKGVMTYGFRRVEILSAQANGITLLVLACFIVYEAIVRLVNPPDVAGAVVLAVAVAGIAVNVAATLVLAGANRRSLNIEGSFQHVLTDLYAFIGTAIAGLIVLTTGFARADAIASLLVAALMLRAAVSLLRASGRVFLEAAPEGVDPDAIGRDLAAQHGVIEVHDLHVWEVTSGFPALSAHVTVERDSDCHAIRRELRDRLHEAWGLQHTTLQVDHQEPPRELIPAIEDRREHA